MIGAHDVRQFMQARVFAAADGVPVIRADLDPPLTGVGVADPPSAHHGYRVGVRRERGLEPVRLLDGMDVAGATPKINEAIVLDQQFGGQLAEWQARPQLSVIRRFLQPGQRGGQGVPRRTGGAPQAENLRDTA